MSNSLQLSEIAIALVAKDLNPAVLNPDFLKYTGIIPTDWELANQPIYNNNLVQLVYKNGVGIIVQPNRLNVLEMIGGKSTGRNSTSNSCTAINRKVVSNRVSSCGN